MPTPSRLRSLTTEYLALAERLRGDCKPEAHSVRGRLAALLDTTSQWFEIGLLIGHDLGEKPPRRFDVITGIGRVATRSVVVIATEAVTSDPEPADIGKILRAQEIAIRHGLPVIYSIDGDGIDLSYAGGNLPGHYGASRVLYYGSLLRRHYKIPQITVVSGPDPADGAPFAAFSDRVFVSREPSQPGAYAESFPDVREYVGQLPQRRGLVTSDLSARPPARAAAEMYQILPSDHRLSYDMRQILGSLLDAGELDEFQGNFAREVICGHGLIEGHPVAVIANQRGVIKGKAGERPRIGGIIYPESARKMAYFIDTASRERIPIVFVQDVSGFMVGADAEHAGIIRAGAELVEAMATATSPRLVLIVNHASGAGYYAMAAQGFEPDFSIAWPTGRIGAMEGEAAISAAFGTELARAAREKREVTTKVRAAIELMRRDYEWQLDARFAAARGHVDAIVTPEETRATLAFLLGVVSSG